MTKDQHLALLKDGIDVWNHWREENPEIWPILIGADLQGCDLNGINLMGADLRRANLTGANLSGAYLSEADLFEADLSEANLSEAYVFEANLNRVNLSGADLRGAYLGKTDLRGAYLIGANLREADLRGASLIGANLSEANLQKANLNQVDLQGAELRYADLGGANLIGARLLKTNFENANLTGCSIYGISAWGLNLEGAQQLNLLITLPNQPAIAVDSLEVAQFIHLVLDHHKLREVIESINSKIVLILGRFTLLERQFLLEKLRTELRELDYLPVVFDLKKLASRDVSETLFTLANIARFTIADITNAKNILWELQHIVPKLPWVPIQPILQVSLKNSLLFDQFRKYSSVLETYIYEDFQEIATSLKEKVIYPAEAKARELQREFF